MNVLDARSHYEVSMRPRTGDPRTAACDASAAPAPEALPSSDSEEPVLTTPTNALLPEGTRDWGWGWDWDWETIPLAPDAVDACVGVVPPADGEAVWTNTIPPPPPIPSPMP